MKKAASVFLLAFYFAIILYVFLAVIELDTLENCLAALVFESIGFALLAYLIFCNLFFDPIKIGYFVPLILVTVVYTLVLDLVNMVLVVSISPVWFVLINLAILFCYCLISFPMYIMGRK